MRNAERVRAMRMLGVAAILGIAGSGVLHGLSSVDLLEHLDLFPRCVFREITGFPCPGCGMTRALLLLGQLQVAEAVARHPLAPMVPLAALWAMAGSPGLARLRSPVVGWLGVVLVVGVWLLRTLEGAAPG